jgi:hypothetical protein
MLIMFGVFTSMYRYHLKEASRYQHYVFGLRRIRIAANNSKTGFEDVVRQALTDSAFTFESGKIKKFESPIPGHPTSDLSAMLIQKIFDSIEVKSKKDKSEKD